MYKNNIYINNHEDLRAITLLSVPYRNLLIENGFLSAE